MGRTPRRIATLVNAALAAGVLLAPTPGDASEITRGSVSGSTVLRVLSYNVKAIPLLTDLDRLAAIGEILRDRRARGDEPDVVLLQEAFSKKSRRIRNRGGYPYSLVGSDGHPWFNNASGLEILSNHPIEATFLRDYRDCAGADCLVSKALMGVELKVPGMPAPLLVLNTHLQAQSDHDAVRGSQIGDLGGFLEAIGYSRPLIFGGDFNFKPRHPSYQRFVRAFPFAEAGRFCMETPSVCEIELSGNGRTDYTDVWVGSHDRQFYYQPSESEVEIRPVRLIRNFTEKRDGEFLSDHWGYEVHYQIHW